LRNAKKKGTWIESRCQQGDEECAGERREGGETDLPLELWKKNKPHGKTKAWSNLGIWRVEMGFKACNIRRRTETYTGSKREHPIKGAEKDKVRRKLWGPCLANFFRREDESIRANTESKTLKNIIWMGEEGGETSFSKNEKKGKKRHNPQTPPPHTKKKKKKKKKNKQKKQKKKHHTTKPEEHHPWTQFGEGLRGGRINTTSGKIDVKGDLGKKSCRPGKCTLPETKKSWEERKIDGSGHLNHKGGLVNGMGKAKSGGRRKCRAKFG